LLGHLSTRLDAELGISEDCELQGESRRGTRNIMQPTSSKLWLLSPYLGDLSHYL
jgi:hypothetical protein